ncbi:MAG: hypothetical protein LBQ52_04675 [Helicobacteraceae bacterium]|jgi:hypothetical protein|nr:hypothetical protein [Helicobacteraceae bacterium]
MAVNQVLSCIPDPPLKGVDLPAQFDCKAAAFLDAFPILRNEVNTFISEVNLTEQNVNTKEQNAVNAGNIAIAKATCAETSAINAANAYLNVCDHINIGIACATVSINSSNVAVACATVSINSSNVAVACANVAVACANVAITKAGCAATSQDCALVSQNAAAVSATNAANSATISANCANVAVSCANVAIEQAVNAANSAAIAACNSAGITPLYIGLQNCLLECGHSHGLEVTLEPASTVIANSTFADVCLYGSALVASLKTNAIGCAYFYACANGRGCSCWGVFCNGVALWTTRKGNGSSSTALLRAVNPRDVLATRIYCCMCAASGDVCLGIGAIRSPLFDLLRIVEKV